MKFIKYFLYIWLFMMLGFPCASNAQESLPACLFVSVIQDPPTLTSRKSIEALIEFSKKANVKILFVQVYRANQAWFNSKIVDASQYKKALKNVKEDPLALLIKQAHEAGIEVHAWLNMLSLSKNTDSVFLKKYGYDVLTRNRAEKKTLEDYQIDNQYFLEPGDLRVRQDLLKLVKEFLCLYPTLDGIQFDYIRYPDENPEYGYTPMNMERFTKATGCEFIDEKDDIWRKWKRDQVTSLLKDLVAQAREVRPYIKVSATGCVSFYRAYDEAFQDWPGWINNNIVDFVTMMSYTTSATQYEKDILEFKPKILNFKKVYMAVGAYESKGSLDVFDQQINLCKSQGAGAFVVLHYGNLVERPEFGKYLKIVLLREQD